VEKTVSVQELSTNQHVPKRVPYCIYRFQTYIGLKITDEEDTMDIKDYFDNKKGLGVLSTADRNGIVNSAIYARPHVMEDGSLAFIMRDRLTHKNIQSNPSAIYLFREDAPGFHGKRLYLTRIREEENTELISSLSRRTYPSEKDRRESKFLVFFKLEKERPLVGG
jgi:hypothetical protein